MQRSKRQIRYSTCLFIAAAILLIFTYVYNLTILNNTEESANRVAHTYHVKEMIERLYSDVKDAERGERGYLLTTDSSFLQTYHKALKDRQATTQKLESLLQDNPIQRQNLHKTIDIIQKREAILNKLLDIQQKEGIDKVRAIILKGQGRALMSVMDTQVKAMLYEEDRLLHQWQNQLEMNRNHLWFFTWIFFILTLAALVSGYISLRKALSRIHHLLMEKNSYAEQLEQSNQELALVATIASHDLAPPLRKMNFFIEQIQKDPANQFSLESRDFFQRFQKSSEKMQTLIEHVLAIARRKKSQLPAEPINLNILAQEVTEALENQLAESRGQIQIDEMCSINGNKYDIAEILQNLIENSLKSPPPGIAPKVEISANRTEDGGCEIRVKDNSLVVVPAPQADIFGWLRHNPEQVNEALIGMDLSGIGLGKVRKIALRHQGSVRVESKPGKGSEFIVTLPKLAS